MNTLWSNLSGHYSVCLVLGALTVAGMGWSGENSGALRGVAEAGGSGAAAAANVRSADIVSAEAVAIPLRRSADAVAVGTICHGLTAIGDQVVAAVSAADGGGGGRLAARRIASQYITPQTKFYDCESFCDLDAGAFNGSFALPFSWFLDQKKRKGAAA